MELHVHNLWTTSVDQEGLTLLVNNQQHGNMKEMETMMVARQARHPHLPRPHALVVTDMDTDIDIDVTVVADTDSDLVRGTIMIVTTTTKKKCKDS